MVTDDDRAVVERQLGRAPRAFRRVAVRCPFGGPAVTEQAPFDADGEPFPTQFYLTCRAPRRRSLAARGRRRRRALDARPPRDEPGARREPRAGDESSEQRASSPAETGPTAAPRSSSASAARRRGSLKCLHAHAAFALARPGYELGDRILAEVEPLWPDRCCCAARSTADGRSSSRASSGRRAAAGSRPRASDRRRYGNCSSRSSSCWTSCAGGSARRSRSPSSPPRTATPTAGPARCSRNAPPAPGWPRDLALVAAAAFDAYQRGAATTAVTTRRPLGRVVVAVASSRSASRSARRCTTTRSRGVDASRPFGRVQTVTS